MEKNHPKTKLTARDKSQDYRSPSPRLKTFPAEKIKKIDGNSLLQQPGVPQLNCHEPLCVPSLEQNIGFGDVLATSQQIQITPRHQSKSFSVSQQNVPNTYRVGNPNQSEGVLPSQKPEEPVGQAHRPFVANLPNGVTNREVVPKKPITPRSIISHMPTADLPRQSNQEQNSFNMKKQESMKAQESRQQASPQISFETPEPDYEKQPIGGRVAALHRQRILQQKEVSQKPNLEEQIVQKQIQQEIQQQPMHLCQTQPLQQPQIPQEQIQRFLSQNFPPVSHDRVLVWPNAVPRNESVRQQMQPSPQQLYEQFQKNVAYQQLMQERAMAYQQQMMRNQMQQRAYYDYYYQQRQNQKSRSPGITSPQDLSVNRETNHHVHNMSVGSQGYDPNLIPSTKDDPCVRTQQQSHTQNSQWQQSQTNQGASHNQNNLHTTLNTQPNQNYLKNNLNEQMKSIPQHQIEPVDTQQKQLEGKKVYQFTPQMIRDQEQLIATMQQQRIPEEVMQRQFQLLLNEQKKQLAYLELLAKDEVSAAKSLPRRVSKKITKIESDEKPDWMVHLTPPRIPYSDLESVKDCLSRQNIESVQQHNQDSVQQDNQVQSVQCQCHQHQVQDQQIPHQQQVVHQLQVAHQQHVANQHQAAHQQYQLQLEQHQQHQNQLQQQQIQQQPNLHQTCQHQMTEEQRRSGDPKYHNSYFPYERSRLLSMPSLNYNSPNHVQQQYLQHNCPNQYYQQVLPEFQQQNFKNWQQPASPTTNLKTESKNNKSVEHSSLLQLRLYKEVIQPQKRNNGLQDPETVQKAVEALKNAETKKGLEYLANLNKKEAVVRLNGVQEPSEIPENLLQRPPESYQEIPKHVSANGLENKRNLNNPAPPPATKIRHLEDRPVEYPRTKNSYKPQKYIHVAERENGSVASNLHPHQHSQIDYPYNQMSSKMVSPTQNLGYNQQLQQFYKSRQMASDAQGDAVVPELRNISGTGYMNQPGGDHQNIPSLNQHGGQALGSMDLQQPRIIGGVTYLARKPNYIPNIEVSAGSYSTINPILSNMIA